MKISEWMVKRTAACLALLMAIPLGTTTAAIAQQPAAPSDQVAASQQTQSAPSGNAQTNTEPQSNNETQNNSESQNGTEPQNGENKPVGTAVAPYEKTTGVTASRPAGAVIAPAKQRRVRAILIKVGVIVGAGVAIGTVAALSHGSSSRP